MNDLYHFWSDDLKTGATGDLLPVNGTDLGKQRILRRLLTNPGDYPWHPDYGAGLPSYIGTLMDTAKVAAVIRSQLTKESCVAQLPSPEITIVQLPTELSGFTVSIKYNDSTTNTAQVLSFNVTN